METQHLSVYSLQPMERKNAAGGQTAFSDHWLTDSCRSILVIEKHRKTYKTPIPADTTPNVYLV